MRAGKYVVAGAFALLIGFWLLDVARAADPPQLTVGSASAAGDLGVAGRTYDEVAADASGDVRVALAVPGLDEATGPAESHADPLTHTIWFTPASGAPTPGL